MKLNLPAKECVIASAVLVMLSACSQTVDKAAENTKTETGKTSTDTGTSTDTASKTSTTASSAADTAAGTKTDTATSTATASETSTASGTDTCSSTNTSTGSSTELIADKGTTAAAPTGAAPDQANGKVNINLNDLPNDVAICSVAGGEIKVGDYRRMLRIQQIQANQSIVSDPQVKAKLLSEAQRLNITLTAEEKTKLLEAAHQQKGQDPKEFQAFLKQTKSTEQQFDEEVMRTGLAFKTSNALIEQTLLSDLVNRELMAQASKQAGGEKTAMNKYLSFKHTKNYEQMLKQTGLSADDLREEMVKAELAKVQLEKIQAQAKASPAEVKQLYDANKAQLKHSDRIKLSTILIACPENDIGQVVLSVRHQVEKANPKASAAEVDNAVSQVMEQSKQKALLILGQAKGGMDFAKLANENSNDPETQAKKTGGNMGFIEKKDIIPALGDVVWKLKAGEVLPQIVKSELGYNIYKVTAKEGPGTYKFEEVKPRLELLAKQAKLQQSLGQWLEQRRKIVKVEFTPKFIAIANATKGSAAKTTQ